MFKEKQKGFVILMATLLSSLFLIIGASIFNIALKELILSSGGRDSQYAFYAADSGMECALYWDIVGGVFPTSTNSTPEPSDVFCASQDVTSNTDWVWKTSSGTGDFEAETIFSFELFPDDPGRQDCVNVIVKKISGDTKIESRGYNTCDTNSLRRVERALRVIY